MCVTITDYLFIIQSIIMEFPAIGLARLVTMNIMFGLFLF